MLSRVNAALLKDGGDLGMVFRDNDPQLAFVMLQTAVAGIPIGQGLFAAMTALALGDPAQRTLRENIKLGGGPQAMWYRFTFNANHRGDPFRLSQWVHCGWRTISGGPFGSTPPITTRAMYPRQVGKRVPDGSYIVVRVPLGSSSASTTTSASG